MYYPFPSPPAVGEMLEVSLGIFWLRMPLPFQLDHVNLWLLRDQKGWTLIDTGFASEKMRALWTQIIDSLDGPITRLIVTHFHPDHLGLASWLLEKTGATLFMNHAEFLTAHAYWQGIAGHDAAHLSEQFRRHGMQPEHLQFFAEHGTGYRRSIPALPDHFERLRAGDTLSINSQNWALIAGYGHSPEHLALYAEKREVFIAGDMLLPKISTNISVSSASPNDNALAWFLESQREMAQKIAPSALVLPSHGLPFKGVQKRVKALQIHHEERLAALEAACALPKTATDLLGALFGRELDTHQMLFAMGEAIAHLNYLEQAGRLMRQTNLDGIIFYQRK